MPSSNPIETQICPRCGGGLAVLFGATPLTFECVECDFRVFDSLPDYAVVQVTQLNTPTRAITGTPGSARQPCVGDMGCILMKLSDGKKLAYEVECVLEDGSTAWVATFEHSELSIAAAT